MTDLRRYTDRELTYLSNFDGRGIINAYLEAGKQFNLMYDFGIAKHYCNGNSVAGAIYEAFERSRRWQESWHILAPVYAHQGAVKARQAKAEVIRFKIEQLKHRIKRCEIELEGLSVIETRDYGY